jgi:hypothetical protein
MRSWQSEVLKFLASPLNPQFFNHKSQASHNERFVSFLNPTQTKYPDWVATGAFYIALHYVNASAVRLGINWRNFPDWLSPAERKQISSHTKRVMYVNKYFKGFFRDYNRLLNESYNARYDPIYVKLVKTTTPDLLFQIALKFNTIV